MSTGRETTAPEQARTTTGRVWNGRTRDERRSDRHERLLEAGIEIMGTRGTREVTVRSVCRATRISERHFYELFDTKEDFVAAVYDRVIGDGIALLTNAAATPVADRGQALRDLLGSWIDFITEDPRRGRIIAVEAATNPELAQRGRQVAVGLIQIYLDYTSPDPAAEADPIDAEISATVLFTGIWGLLLTWQDDALGNHLTRDELIDRLAGLIERAEPPRRIRSDTGGKRR
ncbi:helix-turn-helix domain-containing protein [Nocardia sp. NPDC019395]|uniref:TetR/AcrR family transcriptional regulator n=1 Tax=Nocardia sp. NPDC019395 TaxID=3154686 RepID=UPI0033CC2B5F